MQSIKIQCDTKDFLDISEMREFQGRFKTLSDSSYTKLKGEILDMGFSFPISVWHNENQNYILDGHQRYRTLLKLKDEGFEIPQIPVTYIFASNFKEAKKKLLGAASQFGKVTAEGLKEFIEDADLEIEEIVERMQFPELDFDLFQKEFFQSPQLEEDIKVAEPSDIDDYDSEKDTYSIRVEGVSQEKKEEVINRINSSLKDLNYQAKAY